MVCHCQFMPSLLLPPKFRTDLILSLVERRIRELLGVDAKDLADVNVRAFGIDLWVVGPQCLV